MLGGLWPLPVGRRRSLELDDHITTVYDGRTSPRVENDRSAEVGTLGRRRNRTWDGRPIDSNIKIGTYRSNKFADATGRTIFRRPLPLAWKLVESTSDDDDS